MGAFQCMPTVGVCQKQWFVGPRCWYAPLHMVCKPEGLVFSDIHAYLLLLVREGMKGFCFVPGVLVSHHVLTLRVRVTDHVML